MEIDESIGDSSMPDDNDFVRKSTCDVVHKSISDSMSRIESDIKEIKNAVNPAIVRHSDWIAKHDEESKKKYEISWKLWLLILAPTTTLIVQIIYNFIKSEIK